MREIKFRAWDKQDFKIRKVLGMSFQHDVISVELNKEEYLQDGASRFELMRYTGLKDKKGKELYESDIVITDDSERSYRGIVRKESWYWYLDLYEVIDIIHFDNFSDENDMSADVQIIGNIYENPELLEVMTNDHTNPNYNVRTRSCCDG